MQEQRYEKYLPIGTVVLLKEGTKKVMITGFCVIAEEQDHKMYDYCGVLYPEGHISSQICLFNHTQIAEIYHLGYVNEECKQFMNRLKEKVTEIQ